MRSLTIVGGVEAAALEHVYMHLRIDEFIELAAGYTDPFEGLCACCSSPANVELWTVLAGAEPVAIYGLSTLYGAAYPWAMFTKGVERFKLSAFKLAREVVAGWRERYDELQNFVPVHDSRAIALLRALDFTVATDTVECRSDLDYHPFYWRRVH